MRPAQKAPENVPLSTKQGGFRDCFNEAGAKSAGKRGRRGAFRPPHAGASMRPAQKAPENTSIPKRNWTRRRSFNEAGAKSAGKLLRKRDGSIAT